MEEDGDANTRTGVANRRYNGIDYFHTNSVGWTNDWHIIGAEFLQFYKELFTSSNHSGIENLANLFYLCVIDLENETIEAIPTDEEIKKMLFSMNSYKSPGPVDGMNPNF